MAGERSYAICLELIKSILYLLPHCIGINDIWQRSKEPVISRIFSPQSLAELIVFSGETGRLSPLRILAPGAVTDKIAVSMVQSWQIL